MKPTAYTFVRVEPDLYGQSNVHFIGFRTDQEYWSAVKIWGSPDFIHKVHDKRAYGDIDKENDTVILGSKGCDQPTEWAWQDHELW
tara:strand:+ start:481 stop:738 length:258 start_codon:yes stop_codon:yes gene_type:complete